MATVCNRGTNPNQEGGIRLSDLMAASLIARKLKKQYGGARTRRTKRRKGVPTKRTSPVVSIPSKRKTRSSTKKSNLVEDTLDEAAQLFAAASQTGALGRKRRGVARKERDAMSKRRRLTDTIYNIVSNPQKMQLVDLELTPVAKGKRRRNVGTPPKPPPRRKR